MLVYFPPRLIEADNPDDAMHKYAQLGICIPCEEEDIRQQLKVCAFAKIIPYPEDADKKK